jgi:hypothetical protein
MAEMSEFKSIADEKPYVMYNMLSRSQRRIADCADMIASAARSRSRMGSFSRVIIICFGAIAATYGVATKIVGLEDPAVLIAYTVVGLIIVLVAGLETAFRFDQRATALRFLATEATANLFSFRSKFDQQINVGLLKNLGQLEREELVEAANVASEIIRQQDKYFIELFRKVNELGVDFPLELKEMAEADDRARVEQ